MYSSGEQYHMNSKGVHLHTYYVACMYCDKIIFPTEYQKQMYLRIQESKSQLFKNMLEKWHVAYQKEDDGD